VSMCQLFFFLLIIKCAPSVLCIPPAVLVRKYERLGLSNVHDLGDVSIAGSIPADFTIRMLVDVNHGTRSKARSTANRFY
jgi:hypothetical protein